MCVGCQKVDAGCVRVSEERLDYLTAFSKTGVCRVSESSGSVYRVTEKRLDYLTESYEAGVRRVYES